MNTLSILFLFLSIWTFVQPEQYPQVTTTLGEIRGHYKLSYKGRKFSAFEGIPYAKPPIDNLRFREPIAIQPWRETLNATNIYSCIQLINFNAEAFVSGTEDCLYLNVYVPKETPSANDNYDVIVHIHGGAFMVGSPAMAGPKFLMDKDVIYVNLNYRLGVMGFLSTEDEIVPGNNGMKDQTLALNWVQQHIHQFGGNPKSVTLTGVSAGGAATHFHYFSKLSEGLFHRGISHSGTALAPWAIQQNALERTQYLAALINCPTSPIQETINCLRQKPAKELVDSVNNLYYDNSMLPLAVFAPVIEKNHKGAFLEDHPYNLLVQGNVNDLPWITTAAKDEGVLGLIIVNITNIKDIDSKWDDIAPYLLSYHNSTGASERLFVTQQIKQFYFKNNPISSNLNILTTLCGDRLFIHSLEKSAKLQAKVQKSPIYSYIYGHKANFKNYFSKIVDLKFQNSVNHAEDSALLFDESLFEKTQKLKLIKEDEEVKDIFIDMYMQYAARDQNLQLSNISWKVIDTSNDKFTYLYIHSSNNIEIITKDELAPTAFWDSLPFTETIVTTSNSFKLKSEL